MSEHIHLSVPTCKSKNCKIAQKWKEKSNNWNSVILQIKVKQSMTNVCMVHCTWKESDYQWKRMNNLSFFIESVYFFLTVFLSLRHYLVWQPRLPFSAVHGPRMLDTCRCTLSCGSLHSSVRYRPRPCRVSPGRVCSFTTLPRWSHRTVRVQWLHGPIWPGLAWIPSLDVVLLPKLNARLATGTRWGRALSFRKVFGCLSTNGTTRGWRTPLVYHSAFKSVLHRCGYKSVDDLTSGDLWHYQPCL